MGQRSNHHMQLGHCGFQCILIMQQVLKDEQGRICKWIFVQKSAIYKTRMCFSFLGIHCVYTCTWLHVTTSPQWCEYMPNDSPALNPLAFHNNWLVGSRELKLAGLLAHSLYLTQRRHDVILPTHSCYDACVYCSSVNSLSHPTSERLADFDVFEIAPKRKYLGWLTSL